MHRLRERCVSQRTALSNQARGLLSEYGVVFSPGFKMLKQTLGDLLDPEDNRISPIIKHELEYILDEFDCLTSRLKALNHSLALIAKHNPLIHNTYS